ncbi:hypothetical protein PHLH6_04270 [Pseudomonas sp. Seg1]|nr:hypothetical protein PHLH6_04270 [Pseudomonas sp. Seg1]
MLPKGSSITWASKPRLTDCNAIPVGAGLPAMQTPRFLSQTEVMLSLASQLPQVFLGAANSAFQRNKLTR